MKKLLFLSLALSFGLICMAQKRPELPEYLKDKAIKRSITEDGAQRRPQAKIPGLKYDLSPVETQIGNGLYDRQTNSTLPNRLHHHEDGTFAATWMFGLTDPDFADRGSAYNYFDGNAWGSYPTMRVETDRSGWPCYGPVGENGEMIISHISGGDDDGLLINRRDEKGTGDWEEYLFPGPPGGEALLWPTFVTAGADYNEVYLLSVTRPVANGGVVYQGLDGAMLFSKSIDGGDTWEIENEILDGMTSEDFTHFNGDEYDMAPVRGNTLAFVVGGPFNEAFLMKSTDGGDSFEKTVIWEHPYPMWDGEATDTFYCVDGSWDIKLDNSGMAHIIFGINRARSDGTETFWFPFIDGLGYWNETMPAFSGTLDALNPYGDPGSELIEDYNLIGWSQDVDGDGEITLIGTGIDAIGAYYVGFSSMPQLAIGDGNELYVIYSSVTETYDDGLQNYRHLWSRVSPNAGETWGPFTDLDIEIIHIFDECVFPALATKSDPETLYLLYQVDEKPGMAVAGDEDPFDNNRYIFMEIDKDEITGISDKNAKSLSFEVGQNYPNPGKGITRIPVYLPETSELGLTLVNIMGQEILRFDPQKLMMGSHTLTVDTGELAPGVYFYTVSAGELKSTRKMIVE